MDGSGQTLLVNTALGWPNGLGTVVMKGLGPSPSVGVGQSPGRELN